MSTDNAFLFSALLGMAAAFLIPCAVLFLLFRRLKGPNWLPYVGLLLGLGVGAYLVFVKMFPELLGTFRHDAQPKSTVEVVLPDGYRGFAYIYFDSTQEPLQPTGRKDFYSLLVPESGKLRAGQFSGQELDSGHLIYLVRHLNGQGAQVAQGSLEGGGQSKDGRSVWYVRPFIGTDTEFESTRKARLADGTFFDELEVLQEMRAAAASPQPKPTPASLEELRR